MVREQGFRKLGTFSQLAMAKVIHKADGGQYAVSLNGPFGKSSLLTEEQFLGYKAMCLRGLSRAKAPWLGAGVRLPRLIKSLFSFPEQK